MKTYLVTGGAGFIGSAFLEMMTAEQEDDFFVCLDALTYAGRLDNLVAVQDRNNFAFFKGDINDEELVDRLFAEYRFTHVINFAAETHVDRAIKDPKRFFKTNVLGTCNLLATAARFGIQHFHQVSTDEVYGPVPRDYSGEYFDENHSLNPTNPYSASKASADLLVLSYYRTYKLPVTISRSANNYGPRQHREKLIPMVIERAISGEKIPIYGDGNNIRDWICVYDHCRAIKEILNKGKVGEIFNVSTHNEKSNREIARFILDHLGKDIGLIEFVDDRLGHDTRYALSTKRISSEIGFKPKYSFMPSLIQTIDWYRKKLQK